MIYASNGYTVRVRMRGFDATIGATVPAVGRADGVAFIAATPGGPPIDPALQQPLVEIGNKGDYHAEFRGNILRTYLAAYNGLDVYEVVQFGLDYKAQKRHTLWLERPFTNEE